jgi:hypothetical protein
LGHAPKRLEASIEGGGEHKEDSIEDFQGIIIKKLVQPKISINQKNPIVNIGELIYGFNKLERSFGSTDFGKDEPKNWNSIKRNGNSD